MNPLSDLDPAVRNLLIGALLGWVLNKVFPYLSRFSSNAFRFIAKKRGGRLALRAYESQYLDWLALHLRELKLTGVSTGDVAKKPQLEQVFVSLRVAEHATSDLQEPVHSACRVSLTSCGGDWLSFLSSLFDTLEAQSLDHRNVEQLVIEYLDSPERRDVPLKPEQYWSRFRAFRARRRLTSEESERDLTPHQGAVVRWIEARRAFHEPMGDAGLKRLVRTSNRVAILGVPGAGKSTLLQYIGLAFAKQRAADPNLREKRILRDRLGVTKWKVPIFVRLSELSELMSAERSKGADSPITRLLPLLVPSDLRDDKETAELYFRRNLEKGNCILLLDGLDEVASQTSLDMLAASLLRLMQRYPNNQYFITSRIAAWRGLFSDFRVHYVSDLNDEQVSRFIDGWYSAVEKNSVIGALENEGRAERIDRQRRANAQASDLKQVLGNNAGVRMLATNPMLLSIIAMVHRSLVTLPKERAKLYDECARLLLEQWDIARGLRVDDTSLKLEQKEVILQRIAFAFHTGDIDGSEGAREASKSAVARTLASVLPSLGRPESEAQKLLQHLLDRSGVLIERQRGLLAFAHLTFQEYFAAQHLASQPAEVSSEFLLTDRRILSDWWREVGRLYAGSISDATLFVAALLRQPNDLCQGMTRAAALCAAESVQVHDPQIRAEVGRSALRVRSSGRFDQFREPVDPRLLEYVTAAADAPDWFSNAAVCTVRSGADGLADLLAQAFRDPRPAVNAAAATAVAEYAKYGFETLDKSALLADVTAALASGPAEVRVAAAQAIVELVKRGGLPHASLLPLVASDEDECFLIACGALKTLPEALYDEVWPWLQQRAPTRRRHLAKSLPLPLLRRLMREEFRQLSTKPQLAGDSSELQIFREAVYRSAAEDDSLGTLSFVSSSTGFNPALDQVLMQALRFAPPLERHLQKCLAILRFGLLSHASSVRLESAKTVAFLYAVERNPQVSSLIGDVIKHSEYGIVAGLDVLRLVRSPCLVGSLAVDLLALLDHPSARVRVACAGVCLIADDPALQTKASSLVQRSLRSWRLPSRSRALVYLCLSSARPPEPGVVVAICRALRSRLDVVAMVAVQTVLRNPSLAQTEVRQSVATFRRNKPVLLFRRREPNLNLELVTGTLQTARRRLAKSMFKFLSLDKAIYTDRELEDDGTLGGLTVRPEEVPRWIDELIQVSNRGDAVPFRTKRALECIAELGLKGHPDLALKALSKHFISHPDDIRRLVFADGSQVDSTSPPAVLSSAAGGQSFVKRLSELAALASPSQLTPIVRNMISNYHHEVQGMGVLFAIGARPDPGISSLLRIALEDIPTEAIPYLYAAWQHGQSDKLKSHVLMASDGSPIAISPLLLRHHWELCVPLFALEPNRLTAEQ